jgi:hypothetical protein
MADRRDDNAMGEMAAMDRYSPPWMDSYQQGRVMPPDPRMRGYRR